MAPHVASHNTSGDVASRKASTTMAPLDGTPKAAATPKATTPKTTSLKATTPKATTPKAAANGDDARRRLQILFLDAYDSFTNNIVALLKAALGAHVAVHVVHMDLRTLDADPSPPWTRQQLAERLAGFDAVVCGPGPGSAARADDVGAFRALWGLPPDRAVPVLGICLGFQSLVAHFGGRVRRLRRGGLHGMVRAIDHAAADVFDGVPAFRATLYHSLCADVGQDAVPGPDWPAARWAPPRAAPDLVLLAWTLDGDKRILMAVRHASRPLWGVQYHPESVCTDPAAHAVIRNWFRRAVRWNEAAGRRVDRSLVFADSLDPATRPRPGLAPGRHCAACRWWRDMESGLARAPAAPPRYACRRLRLPHRVDTADVAEVLGVGAAEAVILDSSSSVSGDPLATSSVVALDVDTAVRVEHRVGDDHVALCAPGRGAPDGCQCIRLADGDEHDPWAAWHVVSELWRRWSAPRSDDGDGAAFRGGFMGFVTYEMGLSTLNPGLVSRDRGHRRPDICLAWVTRSVVLDHKAGVAYVQALTAGDGDDDGWMAGVAEKLQESRAWRQPGEGSVGAAKGRLSNPELLQRVRNDGRLRFRVPEADAYERDVGRCQDAIRAGESYELCLTAQTTMTRPRGDDRPHHLGPRPLGPRPGGHGCRGSDDGPGDCDRTPWRLYRTLRARQPAPFGSFVRLGGATVISSSPERFLAHNRAGLCSMRPMKGTVPKSAAVSTLAEAEKILHVPKEEAENLMIVDLVRHDLHGVCGAGGVTVPDLLRVDEYAGVFQMSTVVQGQLPAAGSRLTGVDVLASALPPGSMTGAPKKRSCELLRALEPAERSIYSGVVGYLDARGRGDWSVTIRTMFRWDDETPPGGSGGEVWRIGAGGAVTTLSTPEEERDEMFAKLCGPLSVLHDAV